jgi:hypothetical protein
MTHYPRLASYTAFTLAVLFPTFASTQQTGPQDWTKLNSSSFPAHVTSIHWPGDPADSDFQPGADRAWGAWTVHFPTGNLPVINTRKIITGFVCSNSIAGSHPCEIALWKPDVDTDHCILQNTDAPSGYNNGEHLLFLWIKCPATITISP